MKKTWLRAKFERSLYWIRLYIFGQEYANHFDPFNMYTRGWMQGVEYVRKDNV